MNLSSDTGDDDLQGSPGAAVGEVAVSEPEGATFKGDTGELPLDTRRVLVQLLLGPSVDAQRQSKLWPVLVRDEKVVRARLHELFLELVIDHEHKVAFTRQVTSDTLDVPILLRKASLTFLESALILFLRQKLTQAEAQGDRAVVALAEMKEQLGVYERVSNPDRARFERQAINAVEKVKKLNLVRLLRGGDERYEVSPTLKLLFSAEEIQDLMATYAGMVAAAAAEGPVAEDDEVAAPVDGDDEGESL